MDRDQFGPRDRVRFGAMRARVDYDMLRAVGKGPFHAWLIVVYRSITGQYSGNPHRDDD